jgi:hypothetical protein
MIDGRKKIPPLQQQERHRRQETLMNTSPIAVAAAARVLKTSRPELAS